MFTIGNLKQKNTKEMDWAAYLTSLPFKAQERFIR